MISLLASPMDLVADANFVVAAAVALAAGVVSFASPCVVPLVPGYLSYMTGLAFVYALGLGVPFIAFGLAFQRAGRALAWMRRHAVAIQRTGGGLLATVGVAIATGWWWELILVLQPIIGRWTLLL